MLNSFNQSRVILSFPNPICIGRYYYIFDNMTNSINRFIVPDVFISPGLDYSDFSLWVFSSSVSSEFLHSVLHSR